MLEDLLSKHPGHGETDDTAGVFGDSCLPAPAQLPPPKVPTLWKDLVLRSKKKITGRGRILLKRKKSFLSSLYKRKTKLEFHIRSVMRGQLLLYFPLSRSPQCHPLCTPPQD